MSVGSDHVEGKSVLRFAWQFMRWDEHGWTHYGPAILYDMRAGVDSSGNITAYEATGFSQGGTSLYTGRELLGSGPGSPSSTANALPTSVPGSGGTVWRRTWRRG